MKELRSPKGIKALLAGISGLTSGMARPVKIMEICGTHTMTIFRNGLSPLLLEAGVEMISGPGCPVCITPDVFHQAAINLATGHNNLTLATFGDMTRVPTRIGSLQRTVPAKGSEIRVVYSPAEALDEARRRPDREVVFFGAGFETTIPSIAYVIRQAASEKLGNFSVLTAFWLIPPALEHILKSGDMAVTGFLYPGHVSAIIGAYPYSFVAEKYRIPGAIAGFEPGDVLLGVLAILRQLTSGKPEVSLEYARAVRPEGNPAATALMAEVLEPYDASWRGLGLIPRSGLKVRPAFSAWSAAEKYGINLREKIRGLPGCLCGEVVKGKARPEECPQFGKKCTPDSPLGPCMVSYEGACLIHYKFGPTGGQQK